LIPGIGAQGGDAIATVKAAKSQALSRVIVASSRAIIYASEGDDFAKASREEALKTRALLQSSSQSV
jgi:orotidine-5'-phosphate decarboxylase